MAVSISDLDIISQDVLQITFSGSVQTNDLTNTQNYVFTALDSGDDIMAREILVPNTAMTPVPSEVLIVLFGNPQIDKNYRLTISGLLDTDGNSISDTYDFIGYRTKVDDANSHLGKSMYNLGYDSNFRKIISALLLEMNDIAATNRTQHVGPTI